MNEDAILRAQHPLYDAFCKEDEDPKPVVEDDLDYIYGERGSDE